MKRKILSTLLCVAMALGTLAGCGAKETASDNVVVETEENVENETTTKEEVEVEVEVENENNTNANGGIVVDAERPEGAEVGKVFYTDWGTYTIVSSENGLDNIEVQFGDIVFTATVPQDMGAISSWEPGEKLVLSNETKTKRLMLSCSDVTMEDKIQDDAYTEDELRAFWNNSTKEDGYYFKKEWLNENLLSIIFEANAIDVSLNKEVYGYASWIVDYEKGDCCQFYYAEQIDIANKEVAKIVANSIALSNNESAASNEVDTKDNVLSAYIDSYGLKEGALVLPSNSIVTEQETMLMSTTSKVSQEDANKIASNFVSSMEVYDKNGTLVNAPIEIPVANNTGYIELYYKVGEEWNYIMFMYDIMGENTIFTTTITKSCSVPF